MFTFSVAAGKLYFSGPLNVLAYLGTWHPIRPEDVQTKEWGYNWVILSFEIVLKENS